MRTIYKYPVPIQDSFTTALPAAARIVHVESQDGVSQMWAIVNPANRTVETTFYVTGTGHPIPEDAIYIGSWTSGPFVWHLWRKS